LPSVKPSSVSRILLCLQLSSFTDRTTGKTSCRKAYATTIDTDAGKCGSETNTQCLYSLSLLLIMSSKFCLLNT